MNSEILSEFGKDKPKMGLRKVLRSITRKTTYISLSICLLLPAIGVSTFAAFKGAKGIFILALLLSLFGGGCCWFILQLWERKMQRSVTQLVHMRLKKLHDFSENAPLSQIKIYEIDIQRLTEELEKTRAVYEHQISLMQSSVAKSKEEFVQLQLDMDKKLEHMRLAYFEFEDLRKEHRCLEEEAKQSQIEWQKKLEHKESLITEYQKTITEQRMIIEKKQRQITGLEDKIRDQVLEIRSLLQLEAPIKQGPLNDHADKRYELSQPERYSAPHYTLRTPYDFSIQLHRYIEKAEHLTGVDHLGYVGGKSPRFLDPSLEGYAIDKRRLFDSFKDETTEVVFIYSLAEKKFLFVSPGVKNITGWSQEKFMKEFTRLVVRGYSEWSEALDKIKALKELTLKLAILSRSNQPLSIDCYMGLIGKGPFAHHAIGILVSQ